MNDNTNMAFPFANIGYMKMPVLCKDGPMKGEELWIQGQTTAYFTYRGETGRYVEGKWEAVGGVK